MSKLDTLLQERITSAQKPNKVRALAEQSASGDLSGVAGLLGQYELSIKEKDSLQDLLVQFSSENSSIEEDFYRLATITKEIKAIDRQAILLHGERIKQAQTLLKSYKEGAFSQWLIEAYGNRQTPYNFLLFFELYTALTPAMKQKADSLPRQALYTLASRKASHEEKEKLLGSLQSATKEELLEAIREAFPIDTKDKRRSSPKDAISREISNLERTLKKTVKKLSPQEKDEIKQEINSLLNLL